MNVTISLKEDLCKSARHRAVDSGQSLSSWIADIVLREVHTQKKEPDLLTALSDNSSAEYDMEFTRSKESPQRS